MAKRKRPNPAARRPAPPRRPVPSRPRRPSDWPRTAAALRRRRRLQAGAFAAFAVVIVGGVIALAATRGSSTAGYDTNPRAFVLPALSAPGKVSLAGFSGRPVIVNFFASWCTQCASELPVFDADARALKGRVAVVEVNAEETGDGQAFAARFDLAGSVSAVARDVGGG
ncbi:MAG: TlpA family protein disulfide reductase, partial [Acidobacteriota bacterium]|nr:TlpA family protein disulfide reductase [Acidobacteriota bacterium]